MTDAARVLTSTPTPLYAQIAARLRAQIQCGDLTPGARIPSEHALAERFGVGRPTVRQATELLVRERILERRRGSGTYVSEAPREVDLFSAAGTLSAFERSGIALETKLVGRVRRVAVAADAQQPFAGRTAYFVARRGAINGAATLLEEMYFDPEVFPGLDRESIAGQSLSRLARERFLLRPLSASQRFSVIGVDGNRAEALALRPKASVLKIERTIDFHGAPAAVFAELYCRTDRVAFSQTIALE